MFLLKNWLKTTKNLEKTIKYETYKKLIKTVEADENTSSNEKPLINRKTDKFSNVTSIICRISDRLHLDYSIINDTIKLTKYVAPILEGKRPNTVAAACLLFQLRIISKISSDSISDADLADASKMSKSTLQKTYKILEEQRLPIMISINLPKLP